MITAVARQITSMWCTTIQGGFAARGVLEPGVLATHMRHDAHVAHANDDPRHII